jgi:rhodanese-related sulfurtransferase
MKRTLFGLLLLGSTLFATVTNIPVTVEFVKENKMKIIDIRTEDEWIQYGVIKDAILITFFDEKNGYDIDAFVAELNGVIEKNEIFAIICNTGSRTKLISNFLGKKLQYNVVNLTGGMAKLLREGYKPEYYAPPLSSVMENNRTK